MTGKVSIRLALLAAVAALVAVIVPATLAAGSHGSFDGVAPGGVVLLNMGNGPSADQVRYDGMTQNITTAKNNCTAVNSSFQSASATPSDLLNIQAAGTGTASLGEAKDQIGVQSGNDGNGENCYRTDPTESMTITLGGDVGESMMGGFDLDIQVKFNSMVRATTYAGGSMTASQPGTFMGTGLSDNGPDSEDNFRWFYAAPKGSEFDTLVLSADTGTFSLGGGQNLAEKGLFDTSTKASQFVVGPIADGQISCGDSRNIGVAGSDPTYATVTMHSEDLNDGGGWIIGDCELKPYYAATQGAAFSFNPLDPIGFSGTSARYTLEVTVEDQEVTTSSGGTGEPPAGTITSLAAKYDLNGDFDFGDATGLPHCQFTPPLAGDANYDLFWGQNDPVDDGVLSGSAADDDTGTHLLPDGDSACWFSAGVSDIVTVDGTQYGTEHWDIYLESDPGFSFR